MSDERLTPHGPLPLALLAWPPGALYFKAFVSSDLVLLYASAELVPHR